MNRRACVCFATAGVFLLPVSVGARHPAPSGIRFSYVLPQTLTLHEPVCLVSTISNETSDTAQIDLGQDRKGAYVLAVTQPSGVKIDLPPHSHEGISPTREKLAQEHAHSFRVQPGIAYLNFMPLKKKMSTPTWAPTGTIPGLTHECSSERLLAMLPGPRGTTQSLLGSDWVRAPRSWLQQYSSLVQNP